MRYIWQYPNWTDFLWQSDRLIEPLGKSRFCQGKLLAGVQSMDVELNREAQAEILTEETVRTAQIEGQMLDRDSVRSSVAKHLGLSTAGLPAPDRHTDGLVDVLLDAAKNFDRPLTIERLKSWQAALFPTGYSGLHKIRVGKWRGTEPMQVVSGPVGREKIHFEAPPHDRIEEEIKNFLSWWEESRGKIDGLLRAGIAHFRFITIHPFEDGNGRIARALTDMALAQDENNSNRFYSLSSQIMRNREDYYNILERSQKSDSDITDWLLWFLECFKNALNRSEILISKVFAKAAFWDRHRKTVMNVRQQKAVNRLLEAGPGGFEGGLTTRKYASMTKTSRATAYREIADLVGKKVLMTNQGKGRNVNYSLIFEG
ncbi:Fic family protein [Desulfobacterales bacterium HSG16]|nr:Fic family protein [Desulfobacterales bacterium HSG16]